MKKLAYLLCLAMALSAATGCSSTGNTNTGTDSQAQAAAEEAETADENDADAEEDDDEDEDDEAFEEGEEKKPVAGATFGKPDQSFVEEVINPEDVDSDDADEADDADDPDEPDDDTIVFEELSDGKEVQNAVPIPKDTSEGLRLSYPQLDVFGLDNTAIPWGMGPDRDEYNRPITALQYQQEYSTDYNVDFIIPEDDPAEDKTVYLTFDEGYENGFTPSILDTLKAHHATGIFFVTKPYAEGNPELVQRMIDEGHIVGNHTVHHPSDGMQAYDLAYQTNEVVELNDYIRDNFGYQMCLFRYPTGKFSKQSLAIVSNCGYRSVFWSFAYADWDRNNQPNPSEALAKVESSLHPGAIYLLHAVSETNATILNDFLTYIEDQGYEIGNYYDTLDD